MKKKIRFKRKLRLILSIILVIIVSYTTITVFKHYQDQRYNFFIPAFNETKDEYDRELENLQYSTEEIKTIKKYVSSKNINYLIENKINKSPVLKIVEEKYYIDDNLEKYINYYNDNQDKEIKDIIAIINSHSNEEQTSSKEKSDTTKSILTIINKYYYIDNTYPNEEELVIIDTNYHINNTEIKIKKITYDAFLKMYEEAPEESKIKISTAYRSYASQESIYNYQISEDNSANAHTAKPGQTELQTGYAIDFNTTNTWLKENAHKYGFILRYPENKQHLTGYLYNETYYRYCGIECATYIYENNITYEEYYEYFIKYNNPKGLE